MKFSTHPPHKIEKKKPLYPTTNVWIDQLDSPGNTLSGSELKFGPSTC
jgi:hypothetical protein